MESTTRGIASKYGDSFATVMYEQPPSPENAVFMDFAWRGKVKLYPDGSMRVIGAK